MKRIYSHGVSVAERFWRHVRKTDTCWLWAGCIQSRGYGQFRIAGKIIYAHRFAYELLVGPILPGLEIDHLCRVHTCVNPAHLEPVTNKENSARGFWATKTCCIHGHKFDSLNTYIRPDTGTRQCRACRRLREHLTGGDVSATIESGYRRTDEATAY